MKMDKYAKSRIESILVKQIERHKKILIEERPGCFVFKNTITFLTSVLEFLRYGKIKSRKEKLKLNEQYTILNIGTLYVWKMINDTKEIFNSLGVNDIFKLYEEELKRYTGVKE